MKVEILLSGRVAKIPEGVVFQNVGEQTIFLNMKTGLYYALNSVGSRFWELLVEKKRVLDVFKSMLEEYEVAPETLQQDIVRLFQELQTLGLLDVEAQSGN